MQLDVGRGDGYVQDDLGLNKSVVDLWFLVYCDLCGLVCGGIGGCV